MSLFPRITLSGLTLVDWIHTVNTLIFLSVMSREPQSPTNHICLHDSDAVKRYPSEWHRWRSLKPKKNSNSSDSVQWLLFFFAKLVPLQAGGELTQGLQEVWGSGGWLLAEALPSPAQLSLLDVAVLNFPEELGHHLSHGDTQRIQSI